MEPAVCDADVATGGEVGDCLPVPMEADGTADDEPSDARASPGLADELGKQSARLHLQAGAMRAEVSTALATRLSPYQREGVQCPI